MLSRCGSPLTTRTLTCLPAWYVCSPCVLHLACSPACCACSMHLCARALNFSFCHSMCCHAALVSDHPHPHLPPCLVCTHRVSCTLPARRILPSLTAPVRPTCSEFFPFLTACCHAAARLCPSSPSPACLLGMSAHRVSCTLPLRRILPSLIAPVRPTCSEFFPFITA
jgi:hypothetical protein